MAAPRVRVLGPIEVDGPDGPVSLGARSRQLVAVLAARFGETVPADVLVEAVWDEPPAEPAGALQTLVSRLRSAAGADLVVTASGGYRLGVDAAELDVARFQLLLDRAGGAGPEAALALLDEALELWHGALFGEAADAEAVHAEALRVEELRLVATERRIRRLLELGRDEEAVSAAEAFTARHPLRERALGLLMEALARTGRQTEALRRYADHRDRLAEETGLEPSQELQELELAVLTGRVDAAAAPEAGDAPDVDFPLPIKPRRVERRPGEPVAFATIGDGPPLIYLPGWVSSLDTFADGTDPRALVVARLAETFSVTVFDRYGTGMSAGSGEVDTSLDGSVDEVLALLEELDDGVTLFASSASGPVALAAAARSPRVSRLVLFCTFASGPAVFRKPEVTASLLALVRSSWGMGSRVVANLILPGVDAVTSEAFARFQRQAATPEVATGYLEQMFTADVSHLLGDVTQPALVMHYRDDPAIPFEGARQLSLGLSGSELVPLEGPFHVPPAGHVDRIVAAVVAFATR